MKNTILSSEDWWLCFGAGLLGVFVQYMVLHEGLPFVGPIYVVLFGYLQLLWFVDTLMRLDNYLAARRGASAEVGSPLRACPPPPRLPSRSLSPPEDS